MIIRPRHRSNWLMSSTRLLLAIGVGLFVCSPMTAQAESPLTVQAKHFWLNAHQLKALFQGGIEFSLKSGRGTLAYAFHDDGGWSVKLGSGNAAKGHWEIKRNTICRKETGSTGTWSGLNRKLVCFGIMKKASRLFYGFNKVLITLQDPNVLARKSVV